MSLLEKRYRGFRVVNFIAFGVVMILALGVYLAKTNAGREAGEIKSIERQIAAERRAIRYLQAEVAALERPERIEQLSTNYLGLAPIDAKHETPVEALPTLARPGQRPEQGSPAQ